MIKGPGSFYELIQLRTEMKTADVFLRTQYNYDRDAASDAAGLACKDKSLARQEFKDETNINTIVERFLKTGQLPADTRMPQYADFDGVMDFHSAMNATRKAQESFDRLPAQIRARFHNDPQELLEFAANPDNNAEAIKLGLLPNPNAPEPAKLDVRGEPLNNAVDQQTAPETPKVAPRKEGTT